MGLENLNNEEIHCVYGNPKNTDWRFPERFGLNVLHQIIRFEIPDKKLMTIFYTNLCMKNLTIGEDWGFNDEGKFYINRSGLMILYRLQS